MIHQNLRKGTCMISKRHNICTGLMTTWNRSVISNKQRGVNFFLETKVTRNIGLEDAAGDHRYCPLF